MPKKLIPLTLTKTHKPANLTVFTYFSVGVRGNCMTKQIQILILFSLLISIKGIAQCDTNYLYLDYLKLSFEDSTENLISIEFKNDSDTLKFNNIAECKMIGIIRNKECRLTLITNKSEVTLENINEYISLRLSNMKKN